MNYPMMNEIPTSRQMVSAFGGYNHNLRIGEGEFYDMTNLSSDKYPVLSPRGKRKTLISYDLDKHISGLVSRDGLWYVAGNALYKGNDKIVEFKENYEHRSIATMGAYLVVVPDKYYINTLKTNEHGTIEISLRLNCVVNLCDAEGNVYEDYAVGDNAPEIPTIPEGETPEEGSLMWLDTSGDAVALKYYSYKSENWIKTQYYSRIKPGIFENEDDRIAFLKISEGDYIYWDFEHFIEPEHERVGGNQRVVATNSADCFIVVEDYVQMPLGGLVNIIRKFPDMDYIIESGNRLWGCCYDTKRGINEIYASALGDFKNWQKFDGVSTDSYAASVGTDGAFTGAINYLGYPLFFKENCIHKVYGNYPANYQIQTTNCRGVQSGSSKSLAIVNETLFYKSRSAICAYNGSLPQEISTALGEVRYSNAAAGALGNKYYISMKVEGSAPEKYQCLVFDTAKGLWHKEDEMHSTEFCNIDGTLYYIDYADNSIKTVNGDGEDLEGDIEWSATTGILETDSPDKKYISRIDVRACMEIGAEMSLLVEYDSSEIWEQLFTIEGTSLRTFAIPVRPKRCDHMRLKFEGKGNVKIYSICKTIEQGSDM